MRRTVGHVLEFRIVLHHRQEHVALNHQEAGRCLCDLEESVFFARDERRPAARSSEELGHADTLPPIPALVHCNQPVEPFRQVQQARQLLSAPLG
jgi:hypothetical protein